jgi:hypothetical protein
MAKQPFRVAVINDEISPDFDHACYVAAHDFGMSWMELRSMWGKNTMDLSAAEIAESQRILAKYNLQVTDIASPLFKTDWPDAPRSPYGSGSDVQTTGRDSGEVDCAGEAVQDDADSGIRFLAAGRCCAAPRGD